MKLSSEDDQFRIKELLGKISYLEGTIGALESESIEEMGARIHISGVGGVKYNKGELDKLNNASGGEGGGGGKVKANRVDAMAFDSLKADKQRLENMRTQDKMEMRALEQDYKDIENSLVSGNEIKKKLQAELGDMMSKLYMAEESVKTEKRRRENLQKAAIQAINGNPGNLMVFLDL